MKKTCSWQSQSVSTVKDANALDTEDKCREYRASREHIDPERWDDNIFLITEDLKEAYNKAFGQALEDYNKKQIEKGHPERQIDDYLDHISKGKEHHVMYSTIVQIGDRNDTGIGTEVESNILKDYVKGFVERNPNMYVYSAVIHRDEPNGTDHLHLHYFPVASSFKRGMEVQTSLNRALYEQGFQSYKDKDGNKVKETAQQQWQISERQEVERLCHERGIEIYYKHENREHLSKENYIMYSKNKELEKEIADKTERLSSARDALESVNKDLNKSRQELQQAQEKTFREPQTKRILGKEYYIKEDVQTYMQQMKARDLDKSKELEKTVRERDTYAQALTKTMDERDRARVRLERLQEKQWDKSYIMEQAKEIDRANKEHEDFIHQHSRTRTHDIDR